MKTISIITFILFSAIAICQKYPNTSNTKLLIYSSYDVAFDTVNCEPAYSHELLTTAKLNCDVATRKGSRFKNDDRIECTHVHDYYKSGYDRGHLTPAADNKYNVDAMSDCFYITNICPQKHAFNAGIWERLENKVRYWAMEYDSLSVYCGPVINGVEHEGNLNVPHQFYKIIYSIKHHKAIAFIMSSDLTHEDVFAYRVGINVVSKLSGIKFDQWNDIDKNMWN